jgi:hypothetical protein
MPAGWYALGCGAAGRWPRQHLAAELGADPGPPLQALHQQILRADPALAVGAASTSATPEAATGPAGPPGRAGAARAAR